MNESVDIPSILRLCKAGQKLYSPAYGELLLVEVTEVDPNILKNSSPKIICKTPGSGTEHTFIFNGRLSYNGEIILFPSKDQKDWNLFNIPGGVKQIYQKDQIIVKKNIKYKVTNISDKFFTIKNLISEEESLIGLIRQGEFTLYIPPVFKVGNIIANYKTKEIYEVVEVTDFYYKLKDSNGKNTLISIKFQILYSLVKFKAGDRIRCTRGGEENSIYTVTEFDKDCNYSIHSNCESFKLLFNLQDNYELVEDTDPLIPKFKIGDKIREILKPEHIETISGTFKSGYWLEIEKDEEKPKFLVYIDQDKYELVPEKFNINTLKPFDRVLVRIDDTCAWCAGIFSHISFNGTPMVTGYKTYKKCIPFEGNEHLLGTLDDCSDFYKI